MAYYTGDGKTEVNTLEGNVTLREPDLSIEPQKTVRLEHIGSALTGLYYIEEVSIEVSTNGVTQSLKVSRNGFTDTIMMNNAVAPTNKSKVKIPGGSAPYEKEKVPKGKAPETSSKVYSVKKGDTLSAIAKRKYGKANQWTKIYEANKNKVKNPNLIYPGQKLIIP